MYKAILFNHWSTVLGRKARGNNMKMENDFKDSLGRRMHKAEKMVNYQVLPPDVYKNNALQQICYMVMTVFWLLL